MFLTAMGSTKIEKKHSPRLQRNRHTQTDCLSVLFDLFGNKLILESSTCIIMDRLD